MMRSIIYTASRLRWSVAALVLAELAFIANTASGGEGHRLEPETVVRSLDPKLVLQVVISGSDRKLFAYRQTPEDSFQIAFAMRQTRDAERCLSGQRFTRLLEEVTSLPVIGELRNTVDPAAEDWVVIELWDGSGRAGDETRLRPPSTGNERTILQVGYDQYTVDFDNILWDSVRSGCAGLGAPS
jgi:hypothetical protein